MERTLTLEKTLIPVCNGQFAFYTETKTAVYGDSLGWKMPHDLLEKIRPYVTFLWSENEAEYSTSYCQDTVGTSEAEHICQATCSSFYPLQKDSSIRGVVKLLIVGLAFADQSSFNYLLSNDESGAGPASSRVAHLTDPTLFSGYLHLVLITWFAEEAIDIWHLLPASSQFASLQVKAGFHMIANDRGSQTIAKRPVSI